LEAGSYHPFDIIQCGIEDIGIKGMMGRRAFDQASLGHSTKLQESTDDILTIQEKFLKEFGHRDRRIAPLSPLWGWADLTDRTGMESKRWLIAMACR